jgi:hypothetical protein
VSKQAPAVLPMRAVLGTAPLPFPDLLLLPAYPVIVWDADEFTRYVVRKRSRRED